MDVFQPEWIPLDKAIEIYDSAHKFVKPDLATLLTDDPQIMQASDFIDSMNRWFTKLGAASSIELKGVKHLVPEGDINGAIEAIPTDYFKSERQFSKRHKQIIASAHNESAEEYAMKRRRGERHPDWIDVVLRQASFMVALETHVREYWFDEIAHGKITPSAAEEHLVPFGFRALNADANPKDFLPVREVNWTIQMAIAWIIWRDMEMVVKNTTAFYSQGGYWHQIKVVNQTSEGWILEQAPDSPWLELLKMREALEDKNQTSKFLTIEDARIDLWQKLQSNEIVATGIRNKQSRTAIDCFLWQDLRPSSSDSKLGCLASVTHGADIWQSVTLRSKTILEIWPATPMQLTDGFEVEPKKRLDKATVKPLTVKSYSDKKVVLHLTNWLSTFSKDKPAPTQEECICYLKDKFADIGRPQIRLCRDKAFSSFGWKVKQGARKTIAQLKNAD